MGGVLEVPRKEGGEVPPSLCWYPPPQPLETKKPRYPERWLFHQLRAESQSNWMQGGGASPPLLAYTPPPPTPKPRTHKKAKTAKMANSRTTRPSEQNPHGHLTRDLNPRRTKAKRARTHSEANNPSS